MPEPEEKATVPCLPPAIPEADAERALGCPVELRYAPLCDIVMREGRRLTRVCVDERYGSIAYVTPTEEKIRYVTSSRVRGMAEASRKERELVRAAANRGYVRFEDVPGALGVGERAAAVLVDELKRKHVLTEDVFGGLHLDPGCSLVQTRAIQSLGTPRSLGRAGRRPARELMASRVSEAYLGGLPGRLWGAELVRLERYGYPLWCGVLGAVDGILGWVTLAREEKAPRRGEP